LPPASAPEGEMEVAYVSLMRSDRGKHGMIYTEIGRIGEQEKVAPTRKTGGSGRGL